MKIVVIRKPYDVAVEERKMPEVGSEDILVETKVSVLSTGTEKAVYEGKAPKFVCPSYPNTPGYLNAGEVVEIGKNVDNFEVGNRVASGAHNHQQYFSLSASRFDLVKVPKGVSYDEAATLANVETAYYAVSRASLKAGEVVVVLGQGLMGNLIAQCSRIFGARKVIVTDIIDEKLELARKLGANVTINTLEEDPLERVMELTELGPDVVIEASGTQQGLNQALKMINSRGRIVVFALQKEPPCLDFTNFHLKEPVIIGCGWDITTHVLPSEHVELPGRRDCEYFKFLAKRDYQYAMSLIATGMVKTKSLITRRIAIDKAKRAYELISEDRKIITIALDW